ncbi:hypothetical protein D3C79_838660 [compost metagenome]
MALRAQLEAVDGGDVVKQERQVEQLDGLRVLLKLSERGGDQLHISQQQSFHLLAITKQRRVGIDLDLDLAGQALLDQFFEHQRALSLGRLLRNHVRELDNYWVGGHRRAQGSEDKGKGECFAY